MSVRHKLHSAHLPRGWTETVRSAVLHVMALAHFAIVQARGRAAQSLDPRARRRVKNERLRQQLALAEEVQRIKDARIVDRRFKTSQASALHNRPALVF